MTTLAEALSKLPRVQLAQLPTPLQAAPRLSKALGGPAIYIKREDLTGNPLGGNKTRMFEYVLARVVASGADCVVSGAAIQSNYCRQLSAACARLGLELHLVLRSVRPDVEEVPQGNLLLDLLMGAKVYLMREGDWNDQFRRIQKLAEELRAQGRKPYVARGPNQADLGLDGAAYAHCALEIHQQSAELGIHPTHLYVSAADTTQAGLALGAKALGETYKIIGINPMPRSVSGDSAAEVMADVARKTAAELGLDVEVRPEDISNSTEYVGEGYAVPTVAGNAAVRLVGSLEGILLDPVYTGKAMGALIEHIRQGRLTSADTVVFVHTGGWPALFAYNNYFDFKDQILSGEL